MNLVLESIPVDTLSNLIQYKASLPFLTYNMARVSEWAVFYVPTNTV